MFILTSMSQYLFTVVKRAFIIVDSKWSAPLGTCQLSSSSVDGGTRALSSLVIWSDHTSAGKSSSHQPLGILPSGSVEYMHMF